VTATNYKLSCSTRRFSIFRVYPYTIGIILLIIIGTGMSVGNIAIGHAYLGKPSVLIALVFIGYTFSYWIQGPFKLRLSLVLPPLTLLIYEFFINGILRTNLMHFEWVKGFISLVICVTVLIGASTVRISTSHLPIISNVITVWAYFTGGFGLLQFVLSNLKGKLWLPIPEIFLFRNVESITADQRYSIIRANALSSEPAHYGLSMAAITIICFTMLLLFPPKCCTSKIFRWLGFFMALGGTIVSISLTGWIFLFSIMFIFSIQYIRPKNLKHLLRWIYKQKIFIVLLLLIGMVVLASLIPFVSERLQYVSQGKDRSSNARVIMSLEIMVNPGLDLTTQLFGTGVGLENESDRVWEQFEKFNYVDREEVTLFNVYAYAAVTMGLIGEILLVWIIFVHLAPKSHFPFPSLYLTALVPIYLAGGGHFLLPEWWALLGFLSALRRLKN
jgi:hypothetical protein